MKPNEIEHVLLGSKFFKGMARDDIRKIAGICEVAQFKQGEAIFSQGDFGEHLYIIADGHVSLERSVNLGARSGNVVIEILGKGRMLGCWSTLLNEPHVLMSSANCQKPSTLLVLEGQALREIMSQNVLMGFKLMERLCFLLRDRIQAAYGALEKI